MSYNIYYKLDSGEMENCLKREGIADVCLISFKTGEGYERCSNWLEKNHALVMKSESRIRKCIFKNENASFLDL